MKINKNDIPVVILCGGEGTRLKEETEYRPKPLVEIGGKPILWHIMKTYAHYGFKKFILCLGYKGEMIKSYFLNYKTIENDFTLKLDTNKIDVYDLNQKEDWQITLVDTGQNAMTGARVKKIEKYITSNLFMLTYGDGVGNVNIEKLLNFHISHKKIGTVTGVAPLSRWGELKTKNEKVTNFAEKPQNKKIKCQSVINGGFFVFNKSFFNYLKNGDHLHLEGEPLEKLAHNDQLRVYYHDGFWQCMDTYREYRLLNDLWEKDKPWAVWEK